MLEPEVCDRHLPDEGIDVQVKPAGVLVVVFDSFAWMEEHPFAGMT